MIDLSKELNALREVVSIQTESFRTEVKTFTNRVQNLYKQIENIEDDEQISSLREFVEVRLKIRSEFFVPNSIFDLSI